MTEAVVTAEPDETLATVAERMREHRVGSVVVVDGNRPVGILTERDLVRATAAARRPRTTTVRDWMTADPDCVAPDRPIDQAFASSPSTATATSRWSTGDELVGIVSMRDLMRIAQIQPADEPRGHEMPRGLEGVVVAETAVGDVRGLEGFYHYRQYAAVELAEKRPLEDVWYLLFDGELPDARRARPRSPPRSRPLRTLPPTSSAALPAIAGVGDRRPLDGAAHRRSRCSAAPSGFRPSLDIDRDRAARATRCRLRAAMPDAHHRAVPAAARPRADRAATPTSATRRTTSTC